MGKQDKTIQFFTAVANGNLGGIRYGLSVGGVLPTTRNENDMTSFVWAAHLNKDRSLAEMVRYYDRKPSMLRQCLEQTDMDGNTCMHYAVKTAGGANCVKVLLDAWHTVNSNNLRAGLAHKNERGKRPTDIAHDKAVRIIDEWLAEPEDDDDGDDGGVDENGLTSTQRSKLKKKQIKEEFEAARLASRGGAPTGQAKVLDVATPAGPNAAGPLKMPEPTWEEVEAWVVSVGKNKPLCELNISKRGSTKLAEFEGGSCIDPALWWCESINRLQLQLPKERLVQLDQTGLARLANLTHLIVSGHSLTTLPACIKDLKLKSIDVRDNDIAELPVMPLTLESLDVSNNKLTTLESLASCLQLVSLALDGNKLDKFAPLPFSKLTRLVTLSASGNEIAEGAWGDEIGLASKLETLVLSKNPLVAVPSSVSQLKKLKQLKVDECPVKDKKVLGYIEKGDLKTLGKYLEKNRGGGGGGGKKKRK